MMRKSGWIVDGSLLGVLKISQFLLWLLTDPMRLRIRSEAS
jgi:hypothetical protein